MDKPNRPRSHVISTTSKKFLENKIPDEWFYHIPEPDYGIDYNIEIVQNEQVTGLNFSVQLKSTAKNPNKDFARACLERKTLGYLNVRLEPIMLIQYEDDVKEAYWSWIADFDFDLSTDNQTYSLPISKKNKLSEINWDEIAQYVQHIFNSKSFISDFDISRIHNDVEIAAWKVYYAGDYEQAVYLFRRLIRDGNNAAFMQQALAWSLYQTFQYSEALQLINSLLEVKQTANIYQSKACILAEYGISSHDKGKIIQAKNLFRTYLDNDADGLMFYNYANTLAGLGESEEAIRNYRICLAKNPNNAQCWKNLGTAYYTSGDHEEEIKCYNTALSINPDLHQALFSKGVTLAQIYHRYDEALVLFNRVLSVKNRLAGSYINGLFWVAYAYEQVGNLSSALSWIDKGLNYEGTNLYFLNFKSNLLAKNWKSHSELKPVAKEFFEYRIDLNNDFKSLYHLIHLENWSLEQALPMLQKKTPLYKNVSLQDLYAINFDLDKVLITLQHLDLFAEFRVAYPSSRYINHLICPLFPIGLRFWGLFDIISVYAFTEGIITYDKTRLVEELPAAIFDNMNMEIPSLIPVLIPENDYSKDNIILIFTTLFQGLPTIVYREVGALSGYLTFKMNLRNVDSSEYLSKKRTETLNEKIYEALRIYLQP